ncbi:hypothetical protein TD95_003303 [Thielaviopsis punctulata]|uniref:ferric-chelate reductase (NADPH) n=1 Tax=Thielaviopsis punctulata TaxID=72032 RepID=A0A0F4ZBU6_9PEZI|nr:hypothetical protein TD95_003303 [Thielaviopsis punctulata]
MGGNHIQDFSSKSNVTHHWGYADRVVPCTNDAGSCAYLDLVYGAHDRGMIYMGVLWLTIVFAVGLLVATRFIPCSSSTDGLSRLKATAQTYLRQYLLPNTRLRFLFGSVTRYQVSVLSLFVLYLTIWSFVGMTYKKWVTPVKNSPGVYNTRTSLGPFADRVGVIAYALTPLSIMLASRESFLSYATGIPYTSFLFLHRWVGYLILIQSVLHTIGWCLVEAWLYQPQPSVWKSFSSQLYIVWGFVALGLLVLLVILSFPWTVRHITGYEFFRKAHYVLAMVYIGALIGHWKKLQCFLVPGLVIWAIDRILRFLRPFQLHDRAGTWGVIPAQASVKLWKDEINGDSYRLDFTLQHKPWKVGQHFFLCFPQSGWWQSHPFTPISLPDSSGTVTQSYVIRAKSGETKTIAALIDQRMTQDPKNATISVISTGAYGENIMEGLSSESNILCVAGGTGIAYVLPILLSLAKNTSNDGDRKIELVWAVRRIEDVEWIQPEIETLLASLSGKIKIKIFVTGSSSASAIEKSDSESEVQSQYVVTHGRPELMSTVREFVDNTVRGEAVVMASGPVSMVTDLRSVVAKCNNGSRVWRGDKRASVRLVCDERLEG